MYRTHTCGALRAANVGQTVTLAGWVQKVRNLGAMTFIDLRDRYGLTQIVVEEHSSEETRRTAAELGREFVLQVTGRVIERESKNPKLPTGEIEIAADALVILNRSDVPPFTIEEESDGGDDLRMKYRYLDLRRPPLQRALILRHRMAHAVRTFLDGEGFLEIETPYLIKSTPEGARDFVVPSRMNPNQFYALPQSPQTLKQLLMVAGYDKYFQIVRCFRDEDLRADRQPEFTQIDVEMSFVRQDDVIAVTEGFLKRLWKEFHGIDLTTPFLRMEWKEAMERFGSDKPDLRFGFELKDLSDIVKNTAFKVFAGALAAGGSVRAINVKGGGAFSRKEIDALAEFAKSYRAKGLAWTKMHGGEVSSSFAKFLTPEENAAIAARMELEEGDLILVCADKNRVVFDTLGALRVHCAKKLGLLDPHDYKFLWITDFPLFEYSEEENRYCAMHHPFTMPNPDDLDLIERDPGAARAIAYDIVLNGTELGGGSIRIHDPEIQSRMFRALGLTEEEANAKFGFLLEAFKYGVPPHGGMAFGLDRLVTLALGLEDIRDVIAFPKVQNASELMTKCPSLPDPKALEELSIAVTKTEDDA